MMRWLRDTSVLVRGLMLVVTTLSIAVVTWIALGNHVEGGLYHALITGAVAFPISALVAVRLLGPPDQTSRAVADGLMAYSEGDYSLRLAARLAHDPFGLVHQFNRLGDQLRTEHSDTYQKELLFETVLRAAPMVIVLENEPGRIVYANDTACELLGDGTALVGRLFEDVVAEAREDLRVALAGPGDTLFSVDLGGQSQVYDVARRKFHINTQEHRLTMIRPLGPELERRESEAWKKAIRVMSHELNNSLAPVTSLIHSARSLIDAPDGAETLRSVFDTVEERTKHLRGFLDGFARFARLPQPTPEWVTWPDFVASLRALHPFELDGPLPEAAAWFDRTQIQQVLINLLKNAIEAGSPTDEITLRVVASDDGVSIDVLDHGRGMREDVRARALLPFYSTKKTGTGLGLSLCREIVDAHGGRIALHDRAEGGIRVELWLPNPPATEASA
jgi:nitrogen fixation/metabolism regulation signal transduction histidine kinase